MLKSFQRLVGLSCVLWLLLVPAQADQAFTSFSYPGNNSGPSAITGGSGTSPTSRVTPDRVGDVVNVKEFGALGDNFHDDTANIQTAVNWTASSAKGVLFFPPGIYKVSSPGIDLGAMANNAYSGIRSFIITGSGDASKISGNIAGGYVFHSSPIFYSEVQSGIVTGATAAGNATLNFGGGVPNFVIAGQGISDVSRAGVVPFTTIVQSVGATTITMSLNATGGGIPAPSTGTTTAATSSGSVLTLAGGLPANISIGQSVSDTTTAGVIPSNATVLTFDNSAKTITMNVAVTGGGVLSGDTIQVADVIHFSEGYSGNGSMVIEKLTILNANATAGSGAIQIVPNVSLRISDNRITAQNAIVIQNGVSQDNPGKVTSSAGIGTSTLTFSGGIPAGIVAPVTSYYVFDKTNPAAIPTYTKISSVTATTVVLDTPIAAPGVSSGDELRFGNTALFGFTSTVMNNSLLSFAKPSNGGTANGIGIACSQGCVSVGNDVNGFLIGYSLYGSSQVVLGGRLEVNGTGILVDKDIQGYTFGGTPGIAIIGPSFESNDTSIDMSAGGGDAVLEGLFIKSIDGRGVDGIVLPSGGDTNITVTGSSVQGGFSGYAIRTPGSGAAAFYRTFIGVQANNTSSGSRIWEMPTSASVAKFINSNNPDPTYTWANLPTGGLLPHAIGDTYWISDGKASNCGDTSCTTFGTTVTAGGGALKLGVVWNGTNWTLNGL